MIFLAQTAEPSPMGDVLMAFLSILFEGAPYILVGTILSGFIDAFLPAKLLDRVLPKNKVLSTLIAGFLGLVFPVCECAIAKLVFCQAQIHVLRRHLHARGADHESHRRHQHDDGFQGVRRDRVPE